MSIILDNPERYVTRIEDLTAEELAQAEKATYIVRRIGSPAIQGYTDNLQLAYGRALFIAHRTMVTEGAQIDMPSMPNQRIELRIGEDRREVTVRWVTIEPEAGEATAEPSAT